MSKLIYLGNELSVTNPELVEEWDYDKNFPLTPDDVTYGSNKKAWWICKKCGNNWEAVISSRVAGRGCPKCAVEKRVKTRAATYAKINNLEENYPKIAKQWHPIKNGDLKPNMVSSSSNKKHWWLCPICGGEWQAAPNTRTSGSGCPVCAGKKVKIGYNDLATTEPELSKQWDYENNGELTPQMITRGSNKRVWWFCSKCGNSWESTIHNRLAGNGCPVCGIEKAGKTQRLQAAQINNFAEKYPEIAIEWDYEKNEEPPENFAVNSNKLVWWICKTCKHNWQARIYSRTRNHYGCPKCNTRGSSFSEQALFYYLSKCFNDVKNRFVYNGFELDVYIPSINTAIEYDGSYYHRGKKSLEKDNKKDDFCRNSNIRLLRIRDDNLPKTNYAEIITCKDADIRDLQNAIITLMSKLRINNISIDLEKDRQKILALYQRTVLENSLAVLSPEIAKEWNYEKNYPLTPECVLNGSNHKAWWKCEKGHEWSAVISNRTREKLGCPYCSNQRVLVGYNDLATTNPKLAAEWDYSKNELKPTDVTAGSNKSAWWICPKCGNNWKTRIAHRNKGAGCAICMKKQSIASMSLYYVRNNNLAENYPELVKEWNYDKNVKNPEEYSCSSNEKVWWKCKKGHSWETAICYRTRNNCSCPYCSNQKVLVGYNDLATTNPELLEEWDYEKNKLNPTEITVGSNKKAWWICKKCGNRWETMIMQRGKGRGCPICQAKKAHRTLALNASKQNNLVEKYPKLSSEWNYEKNEEPPENYACSSNKKVWWTCHFCGKIFESHISTRTRNGDRMGCPDCKRKQRQANKKP